MKQARLKKLERQASQTGIAKQKEKVRKIRQRAIIRKLGHE
jgi:hypothetical protein